MTERGLNLPAWHGVEEKQEKRSRRGPQKEAMYGDFNYCLAKTVVAASNLDPEGKWPRAKKQRVLRVHKAFFHALIATTHNKDFPHFLNLPSSKIVQYMSGDRTGLSKIFGHYNADKVERPYIGYVPHGKKRNKK
jgi:hypothetical protein